MGLLDNINWQCPEKRYRKSSLKGAQKNKHPNAAMKLPESIHLYLGHRTMGQKSLDHSTRYTLFRYIKLEDSPG